MRIYMYAPSEKVQAAVATNVKRKKKHFEDYARDLTLGSPSLASAHCSIPYPYISIIIIISNVLHIWREFSDRRGARELSTNPKCNSIFIGVDFSLSLSLSVSIEPCCRREPREYLGCSDSSASKTYRAQRQERQNWWTFHDVERQLENDDKNNRFRFFFFASLGIVAKWKERVIVVVYVYFVHKPFADIFSIYIMCAGKYFDSKYNFIFSDIVCTTLSAVPN